LRRFPAGGVSLLEAVEFEARLEFADEAHLERAGRWRDTASDVGWQARRVFKIGPSAGRMRRKQPDSYSLDRSGRICRTVMQEMGRKLRVVRVSSATFVCLGRGIFRPLSAAADGAVKAGLEGEADMVIAAQVRLMNLSTTLLWDE